MRELCYLPKPTEFEGPKSLLMRMAHYNGFGTVRNMFGYFAISPSRWIDTLGQHSPVLKLVSKQAPSLADDLRKAFYSVAKDSANFIKANNVYLLRKACPDNYLYCPVCIESSKSLVFHDVADIGVCPVHGSKLVIRCPKCMRTESWHSAKLFHCVCGFERRTADQAQSNFVPCLLDPFQSPEVVEEIRNKYTIAKVCASLWGARQHDDNHNCCDLPLKVINHIDRTVAAQVNKYPGFIKSLHRAPWDNYGDFTVAWLADRALNRLRTDSKPCLDDCCRFATIDRNNARTAIFDDMKLVIKAHNFAVRGWMEQQTPSHFTRPPRCEIIRKMNAENSSGAERSASTDGLTKDEAAAFLKCPLSSVNSLLSQGWLKNLDPTRAFQLQLPDVIDRSSTEKFADRYVLLHELSKIFKLPTGLITCLLSAHCIQKNTFPAGPEFYDRASASEFFSRP